LSNNKRRLKTQAATLTGIIDHVLAGIADHPTVLVGPVVRRPFEPSWGIGNPADDIWYFIVASGRRGKRRFEVDQLLGPGKEQAQGLRAQLVVGLVQRGHRIVIIDLADELALARAAEAAWPCAKARQIREGIEADRARDDRSKEMADVETEA
jgi:hypothetical protein